MELLKEFSHFKKLANYGIKKIKITLSQGINLHPQ